jgi:hypothetical protein
MGLVLCYPSERSATDLLHLLICCEPVHLHGYTYPFQRNAQLTVRRRVLKNLWRIRDKHVQLCL